MQRFLVPKRKRQDEVDEDEDADATTLEFLILAPGVFDTSKKKVYCSVLFAENSRCGARGGDTDRLNFATSVQ